MYEWIVRKLELYMLYIKGLKKEKKEYNLHFVNLLYVNDETKYFTYAFQYV
jgi:hypothetical protein